MKKLRVVPLLCCALFVLSGAGCTAQSTLLGKPAKAESLSYQERTEEGLVAFREKAEAFAATFSAAVSRTVTDVNYAVSPISVFSALSLAAECTDTDTRAEILGALGVTYEQLSGQFPALYRQLSVEHQSYTEGLFGAEQKKTTGLLQLGNSVWVAEGTQVNGNCIDSLKERYYCYSYAADFAGKNSSANQAVREFVKEQTNGLIDKAFNLSPETVFTLITTLYLKDMWNRTGTDMATTEEEYLFRQGDGSERSLKLLRSGYMSGRAYETEQIVSFYTQTYHGYKVKFLLPKEGVRIEDAFTAENIAAANSVSDYNAVDTENKIRYYTRCLFPEFKASYDGDVAEILKNTFGVRKMFDQTECDFSALTEQGAFCRTVRHVTDLTVDKKGIEGAAVTVIPAAGSPGPDEYEEVYLDFAVTRSFGFLITDPSDTTLFSGIIRSV